MTRSPEAYNLEGGPEAHNLADSAESRFLCQVKARKLAVSVFLINGIKLQGSIQDYCQNSILLQRDVNSPSQLIYKTAISTIVPDKDLLL